MSNINSLAYPGQVVIHYLKLFSARSTVVDLQDYLVEINIFEDIFANFLHGQIMLSDSRNLISKMPLIGDEYLAIKVETPTIGIPIEKLFRVYSITDIKTQRDKNTQTYVLNFCSIEAINDSVITVYKPFNGLISDVVGQIYREYLESPATIIFEENNIKVDEQATMPFYVENTKNKIKFLSPGWHPSKCLNWLASKAIPQETDAADYLFWETATRGFNFISVEKLLSEGVKNKNIMGNYAYAPPGTLNTGDIISKLFLAEDFEIVKFVDNLQNLNAGYFGSTLSTFDMVKKQFVKYEYNYPQNYNNLTHMSVDKSVPIFTSSVPVNGDVYKKFYPINSKLHSNIRDNYTEKMPLIYGQRHSRLSELNNFKINITVPGRTDMYAGSIVNFNMPDATVKNEFSEPGQDPLISGLYLVSAIRHKINFRSHTMIMEMVKDSISYKE